MRISIRGTAFRRAALLIPTLVSALLCAGVHAQADRSSDGEEQNAKADAVPPPPPGVEEIQIIGERRDSELNTEAIAVTSFDQTALDEFGVQDVESLQDFVPSLHVGRVGNQAVITIRGIGLENISITGKPSVIFEQDGVPLLRPSAALAASFFDLESLDVTRGPQGTRGGYQTTAGKIAITSAKPRPDFAMGGDFQIGTRDQKLTRAYVNIPILGELLMSRLAVYHEDRTGYMSSEYFLSEEQRQIALARPLYSTRITNPGSLNPGIRKKVLEGGAYDLRKRSEWGDDAKDLALRGQLMGRPTDELEWRAIGTYSQQKGVGPSPVFVAGSPATESCPSDNDNGGVCTTELLGFFPPGDVPRTLTASDPRVSVSNERQFRDNSQIGATLAAKWDIPVPLPALGDVRVGAVGSWQKQTVSFLLDLDASNTAFTNITADSSATQRSLEVFAEGIETEDFEWKAGVFFLQEENGSVTFVDIPFSSSSGGGGGSEVSGGSSTFLTDTAVTKNQSAFGEFHYWLTDEIKAIFGVRYTQEKLSAKEVNSDAPNDPIIISVPWSDFTPRGEILWQLLDTSSLSFGVTKGFKPGGFTLGLSALNDVRGECDVRPGPDCVKRAVSFGSERVYQYQITSKNQLFDESLTLDLVLYWTAYSSYQSCQIRAEAFECVGGGKTQMRGVEMESLWRPYQAPGLAFNVTMNILDTRIETFRIKDPTDPGLDQLRFEDISGNRMPRSPLFKAAVGAQYDIDLGNYGVVTPRVNFSWEGDTYFRTFNKQLDLQKAFYMADVRLAWTSADARYKIDAGVDNVTDVDVRNNIITGPLIAGTPVVAFYRPPRTWSLRFGWNWQ